MELSNKIYTKDAILKTVYLFHSDFVINVDEKNDYFVLEIKPLHEKIFDENNFLFKLQEQQLRETLNSQFGSLRDKIYQKAFELVD